MSWSDFEVMRVPLMLVAALGSLASLGFASPDRWGPFVDNRVVAPDGKSYVVARATAKGHALRFEYVARRAGAARLLSAEASRRTSGHGAKGTISRDPQDRVLATGVVPQLPLRVHVLDDCRGFVLFEKYGGVGHGQTLTCVGSDGKIVFTKTLAQVFGKVPDQSEFSVTSIWWEEAFWIDSKAHRALLVARGDVLREVDLNDGKVTVPSRSRLIEMGSRGDSLAKSAALELLARHEIKDRVTGAAKLALSLVRDERRDLGVRLRAAVLLKRSSNRTYDSSKLFGRAFASKQLSLRRYAVQHAVECLGFDAAPHLRRVMRFGGSLLPLCRRAFVDLGERAVPLLVEMLGEEAGLPAYRGEVADALGKIASPKALPALRTVVNGGEPYAAQRARLAVRAIRRASNAPARKHRVRR